MEMNGSCIEGLVGKVYRTFCTVDKVLGENSGKVKIFQNNERAWKGGERN